MSSVNFINSVVTIRNNCILKDGVIKFKEDGDLAVTDFLKTAYTSLDLAYAKFFKMDNLSKLVFLGASVIFGKEEKVRNTGIVLSNRTSSLDTDTKHQRSIEDENNFYPSPAVFVYTLPNIAIGEISIKYRLQSENAFFIFDAFNFSFMHGYAESLISQKKATDVLCGWVDVEGDNYEAFLYTVNQDEGRPHTVKELIKLYQNKY